MYRRSFLKTMSTVAPMLVSARTLGLNGPGANEMVNVGLIGLGGRCKRIVRDSLGIQNLRIAAVCDCFKPAMEAFMKEHEGGPSWNMYTDFRRMIESENLDGVMVETTTHARAWVTCHAMAMGMDVYIEKPMSLTIAEGREMVNTARKYKRVTQVGTQQRTIPLNNWASDLVKNGALGKITEVLAPNFIGPLQWKPREPQPLPAGGSSDWWDIWTN